MASRFWGYEIMNQEKLVVNFWSPAISINLHLFVVVNFPKIMSALLYIFSCWKHDAEHPSYKRLICSTKEFKPFQILHKVKPLYFVPDSTTSRFHKNLQNCYKTILFWQPKKGTINLNRRWMCSSLKKLIFQFASVVSKTYLQRFIIRWLSVRWPETL